MHPCCAGRPYSRLGAYAQSKLAEVVLCEELESRIAEGRKLRVVSVHPGNVVVRTQIHPPAPSSHAHWLRWHLNRMLGRLQTGVVRTLPVIVQRAYEVIMSNVILSPYEARPPSACPTPLCAQTTLRAVFRSNLARPADGAPPAARRSQGARSVLYAACSPEVEALPRPGPYLESGCKCASICRAPSASACLLRPSRLR